MALKDALLRRKSKGNDGAFLYELQTSYELSPKVSEQILYSAKDWLLQDGELTEGQIEITLIEWEERRIRLTLDAGIDDLKT